MDRRQFIASGSALALTAPSLSSTAFAAPAVRGDAALRGLLDAIFADDLLASPEDATGYGLDKDDQARLRSMLDPRGDKARKAALKRNQRWLAKVKAVDASSLSDAGRSQREVAEHMIQARVAAPARFAIGSAIRPYPIFQQGGAYFSVPNFLESQHPGETVADAEAYLARLSAFAVALDADTAEQKRAAMRGFLAPGWSLDLTLGQMAKLRGVQPEGSGMVQALVKRATAKGLPGDWQGRAAKIVGGTVYPALDRQIALMAALRPTTRPGDGVARLPRGDEIYALALAQSTTTTLSPDAVHAIGLTQVAEISAQLEPLLRAEGLTRGGIGERLAALNVLPSQLYPDSDAGRRAMIADLNVGNGAMQAKLSRAFNAAPNNPLEIRRVPPEIQDGASNGYYYPAALDGSRPAIYWINLKSVGDWPKYSLPALTYHEGVPGHHLQGGISQGAGSLPLLLSNYFISAYGEGWALYAEEVADELGGYTGIERAGYLQSFLFRASRLVIDTGLHSKGWSREKATDYMVSVTGFARPRCQREVERYCTQPGQACSYKIGHTAWVNARKKAQVALGERFDVKWFHEVLADGSMPLTMLERRIEERTAKRLRTMG